MIEILSGILKIKHPTFAVIDCNGVGFGVQISTRTGESLPEIGAQVSLFTHLVVREDSLTLFGFSEMAEKELFLKMIDVNGIGPKMAQRILSSVSPSSFLDMIAREDKNALSKIKGIGKKTVEQLIISLKDKATALQALSETSSFSSAEQEAFLALQTLGVKESAAKEAIKKAKKNLDSEANTATLISEALKHI